MDDFIYLPAYKLAELIRTQQATSYDIVKAHIEQIEKHNNKIAALISLFKDDALSLARKRDTEVKENTIIGPLHGVPVTIKEMYWLKGQKSNLNAKIFKGFVAGEDATCVKRVKNSGAIVLGQSNLAKMVMDYQVLGDIYPEGKNPYNTECTPGGSTGGGAAAVAAGFTPLELGSDIAGSCRLPAAFCGVYGMKPTDRTQPLHGFMPETGDEIGAIINMALSGPLARHPKDLEIFWKLLSGSDIAERDIPNIDWPVAQQKKLSDFNICWTTDWPGYPTSSETKQQLTNFINVLDEHSVNTTPLTIENNLHQKSLDLWMGLFPYVTATSLTGIVRMLAKWELKNGLFKGWKNKENFKELDKAYKMDARHYAQMINCRNDIVAQWEKVFQTYDVLVCPVSYDTAFKRRKTGEAIELEGKKILYPNYGVPFVACFSATGHPAISIPLGLSKDNMPYGIQIVGAYWSDAILLKFAQLVHEVFNSYIKPDGF